MGKKAFGPLFGSAEEMARQELHLCVQLVRKRILHKWGHPISAQALSRGQRGAHQFSDRYRLDVRPGEIEIVDVTEGQRVFRVQHPSRGECMWQLALFMRSWEASSG